MMINAMETSNILELFKSYQQQITRQQNVIIMSAIEKVLAATIHVF